MFYFTVLLSQRWRCVTLWVHLGFEKNFNYTYIQILHLGAKELFNYYLPKADTYIYIQS